MIWSDHMIKNYFFILSDASMTSLPAISLAQCSALCLMVGTTIYLSYFCCFDLVRCRIYPVQMLSYTNYPLKSSSSLILSRTEYVLQCFSVGRTKLWNGSGSFDFWISCLNFGEISFHFWKFLFVWILENINFQRYFQLTSMEDNIGGPTSNYQPVMVLVRLSLSRYYFVLKNFKWEWNWKNVWIRKWNSIKPGICFNFIPCQARISLGNSGQN